MSCLELPTDKAVENLLRDHTLDNALLPSDTTFSLLPTVSMTWIMTCLSRNVSYHTDPVQSRIMGMSPQQRVLSEGSTLSRQ